MPPEKGPLLKSKGTIHFKVRWKGASTPPTDRNRPRNQNFRIEADGKRTSVILRRHRHRAAPVQFHSLEQADLVHWRIGRTRTAFGRAFAVITELIGIVRQWIGLIIYATKRPCIGSLPSRPTTLSLKPNCLRWRWSA